MRLNLASCDLEIWAAAIAQRFASEIGEKPGSYWIPGCARSLALKARLYGREAAEAHTRESLGLSDEAYQRAVSAQEVT